MTILTENIKKMKSTCYPCFLPRRRWPHNSVAAVKSGIKTEVSTVVTRTFVTVVEILWFIQIERKRKKKRNFSLMFVI